MRTLTVNRNQIDYVGTFERPAFSLVGNTRIMEGLYDAFSVYQVTLADFRLDTGATVATDFGVNVFLKSLGQYRLRFDRVEWSVSGFVDEDMPRLPEVLKKGEEWLRTMEPSLSFKSHTFVYNAHCQLSEGTSKEFLLGLHRNDDLNLGESLGNGLIHSWRDTNIGGRFNLVIDHSLFVKDGIFIQLISLIEDDQTDHSVVFAAGQTALNQALNNIGLQLEQEKEITS